MSARFILFGTLFILGENIIAFNSSSSCDTSNSASNTCSCIHNGAELICCKPGDISTHKICPSPQSITSITDIFIEGSSPHFVNLTDAFLERLGVAQNRIERLTVHNTALQHVNICQVGSHWCKHLQQLDLRNNNISRLEEPKLEDRNGFSLFLSGNQWPFATPGKGTTKGSFFFGDLRHRKEVKWSYSDNTYSVDHMWLLDPKWNKNWQDINATWCPHVEGFIERRQLLSEMLSIVKRTFLDCPDTCTCTTNIQHNKDVDTDGLEFPLKTLCVGINLKSLPSKIPARTDYLDVSDNQIESLDGLKDYKHLRYLIMKANKVTSLRGLIDTPLITDDPQEIDLSHNQISSLTVLDEAMSKMAKSINIKRQPIFFFSSNPLVCTCGGIEKTQQFIFKYANTLLRDHLQLKCADTQSTDDIMRGRLISQIEGEQICGTRVDPLVIVIILEVVLIVILLGNLYFDYIRYQRTGVLPWMSVMLPDWIPLPNLPNTFLNHRGGEKKRKKCSVDSNSLN